MSRITTLIASASLLAFSVSAAAQTPPQPSPPQAMFNPNEVVCEKQKVVGSRLAVKRICKTRAQWAEQRQQDRMEIEKVQVQRGSCDGCP